jgi:hypothetical protein
VLTLAEAQKYDRLEEFIAEQEAAGIGPIEIDAFKTLAAALIKAPPPEGQTSHFSSDGNSSGKRIRPDSGQGGSD